MRTIFTNARFIPKALGGVLCFTAGLARHRILALLAIAIVNLAACGGESTPPEQQIRRLNEAAEAAVKARDVSALKDMVAEDYRDERGGDRSSVVRLVQFYMLGHQSIHLYTVTRSLQVLDEAGAVAEIIVAVAGEPIESADQLFDLRADLLRLNVRYTRQDDEWRVIDADWRRAAVEDFL